MIPITCPDCGSSSVVAITYGEPTAAPANDERVGGCVVAVDSPRWGCRNCDHRWGSIDGYDFANLADLLGSAVVGAMWSVRSEYQGEGIADALGELEQLAFIDDDAEQARLAVIAALGSDAPAGPPRELQPSVRDKLAAEFVDLLRYAERKAADG